MAYCKFKLILLINQNYQIFLKVGVVECQRGIRESLLADLWKQE